MQTDNPDEFFDISTRNKKFGRVDALNGPKILEKYVHLFFTRGFEEGIIGLCANYSLQKTYPYNFESS